MLDALSFSKQYGSPMELAKQCWPVMYIVFLAKTKLELLTFIRKNRRGTIAGLGCGGGLVDWPIMSSLAFSGAPVQWRYISISFIE